MTDSSERQSWENVGEAEPLSLSQPSQAVLLCTQGRVDLDDCRSALTEKERAMDSTTAHFLSADKLGGTSDISLSSTQTLLWVYPTWLAVPLAHKSHKEVMHVT